MEHFLKFTTSGPTLIDYFRKLSYDELPQNLVPVDMEVRDSYIKQHVGELIRAHYFGTNTNVSLLQILEVSLYCFSSLNEGCCVEVQFTNDFCIYFSF